MHLPSRLASVLLVLATPASLFAAAPDLDTQCLDCHRPGQVRGEVPLIEGQQADYLRHQLQRFRDRHRLAFPMSGLAAGLDDAAIDALVKALSARPWPVDRVPVSREAVERGRRRAGELACDSCHGEDFRGAGDIPRTAGQQPGYLARQIAAFGVGHRWHPPTGTGTRMHVLEASEARDIAAFLHALGAPAAAETGKAQPSGAD